MFNHRKYLDTFLSNYKHQIFTNNSVARIERFVDNKPHYHIIGIHKLLPEENKSKHNLYLDVVDIQGKRIPEKIAWGWSGQRENEIANPVILDKPANEPSGNISIGGFQIVWAKVLGKDSDTITNVTTGLPDDGPNQWNTWGHHSYYCVWMWVESTPATPPVPPVITPPSDRYEEGYKAGRRAVADAVMELINKIGK